MTAVPTQDNQKSFMVFDGEPSTESFLFDGNFQHFAECFFMPTTWEGIVAWAETSEYVLVIEGTDQYKDAQAMIEESAGSQDFFDEHGNIDDLGIYDAGGHADVERYLDYADNIRDRIRDEG